MFLYFYIFMFIIKKDVTDVTNVTQKLKVTPVLGYGGNGLEKLKPLPLNRDVTKKRFCSKRSNKMTYTIKTNQGEIVVNDGILSNEEYQAIKIHRDRKNSLGTRLVILREYIKQSYNGNMDELEDLLDCTLKENNYDLEQAIDHYRSITQKQNSESNIDISLCQCGYRKPFCLCSVKN